MQRGPPGRDAWVDIRSGASCRTVSISPAAFGPGESPARKELTWTIRVGTVRVKFYPYLHARPPSGPLGSPSRGVTAASCPGSGPQPVPSAWPQSSPPASASLLPVSFRFYFRGPEPGTSVHAELRSHSSLPTLFFFLSTPPFRFQGCLP